MAPSSGSSGDSDFGRHASPEELAAYTLDPTQLDFVVQEHIATCAVCAPEAEWVLMTVQGLDEYPKCPTVDALVRFALGESAEDEQLQVAAHLRTCGACTNEVELTRRTFPSAEVEEPAFAYIRRIVATINPSTTALALQQRGITDTGNAATTSPPRIYTAENLQITITVESDKAGGSYLVSGVIQPVPPVEDAPGVQPVALLYPLADHLSHSEAALISEAPVKSDDYFDIHAVPAGSYRLDMIYGDQLIEVQPIEVP